MQTVETTLTGVCGFLSPQGGLRSPPGGEGLILLRCCAQAEVRSPAGKGIAEKICTGGKAGLHNFHGEVKMGVACNTSPAGNGGGRHQK